MKSIDKDDMVIYTDLGDIERISNELRKKVLQYQEMHVLTSDSGTTFYNIQDLEYEVLFEIPRILIKTTVFPNGNRYYHEGVTNFLSWIAQVLRYSKWDQEFPDSKFQYFFSILLDSLLFQHDTLYEQRNNLQYLFGNLHILTACYAFPLLERCIRAKCRDYISLDGTIIQNFNIQSDDKLIKYRRNGQPKRISSLSHELILFRDYVSSTKLRKILNKFFNELNEDAGLNFKEPYMIISDWRNRLLHGEEIWSIGLDVSTYLITMLYLDCIPKSEYNEKKRDVIRIMEFRTHSL